MIELDFQVFWESILLGPQHVGRKINHTAKMLEIEPTLQWASDPFVEAARLSGQSAGFEICRSRVQIPFRLLMLFLVAPEFNRSAMLVNTQLVCLLPVGIHNLVTFI